MVDYIGSDAVKKYYKERGIVLSDRMIAARICNAGFKSGEIYNSLREIQTRTGDAELKRQIDRYIGREKAMYEKVEKSATGDIYRLSVWYKEDDRYSGNGYFSDFETALSMMREIMNKREAPDEYKKYKIEKFHMLDSPQISQTEEYWSMGDADGYAEYDSEGEVFNVWAGLEEEGNEERLFIEEYFYYPHPFKRGDILERRGNDETLYIMSFDPEEEAEYEKRRALQGWGDLNDIGIAGTMISRRTGRIWTMDERVNPLDFEYARIDNGTEDVIERAALEMQRILLGKAGSFQYIFDACARRQEDYLESTRISLITGIELHPHHVFF